MDLRNDGLWTKHKGTDFLTLNVKSLNEEQFATETKLQNGGSYVRRKTY